MGDIVYWGNGTETLGEYEAPKDVAMAAPNCEDQQVEVDWGDGDIELLPGTIWSIQKDSGYWVIAGDMYLGRRSGKIQLQGQGIAVVATQAYFPSTGFPSSVPLWHTYEGDSGCSSSSFFVSSRNSDWWLISLLENELGQQEGCMWGGISNIAEKPSSAVNNIVIDFCGTRMVVTDLGGESSRQSSSDPIVSLTEGKKAIAITYADNTTEELPLNACPEWVRVRSDQECPENTCRVECEDHYCCYGCGGTPVLEIPK